jgi:large subunit ribosomal protein L15
MNLSDIKKVKVPRKYRFIVGRGESSGLGKTSGKGHKGQKARSGFSSSPWFEGGQTPLIRRIPKKGFSNFRFRKRYTLINVKDLNVFEDGDVVNRETLAEKGLVKKVEKDGIKILGDGELSKKLVVVADRFSEMAVKKIEKAGGRVEIVKK